VPFKGVGGGQLAQDAVHFSLHSEHTSCIMAWIVLTGTVKRRQADLPVVLGGFFNKVNILIAVFEDVKQRFVSGE
jgi:hypothetical protein